MVLVSATGIKCPPSFCSMDGTPLDPKPSVSVSFADPAMWAVHVGVTEQPSNGAKSLAVERIIFHDRYRPKGLDYDVALMKLKTTLEFNGTEEKEEEEDHFLRLLLHHLL